MRLLGKELITCTVACTSTVSSACGLRGSTYPFACLQLMLPSLLLRA
jgi:hypothetical protein